MLRLTVLEGRDRGTVFDSSETAVTLGTGPENDVRLTDPYVSGHHGRIGQSGAKWLYRDLGSTNGSSVEREGTSATVLPSGSGYPLMSGDRLLVGQSVLLFEVAEPEVSVSIDGDSRELGDTVIVSRDRNTLETTRRRQLEDAQGLAIGYQFERDIGLTFDPEAMLDTILGAILKAFPSATHAIILLVDKKTLQPRRQIARVRGEEGRLEEELPISTSIAKHVLEEGKSVLFRDVPAAFEDSQSVVEAGITASLCAPLWTGDETVGLIQVDSRGGPGRFAESDLDQLALFANRAALAIVGSELHEAEQRNQLARDLADMITHDLKGPLTSVIAFLELLSREQLDESQHEYVGLAHSSAKWLAVLVAGILDVARMDAADVKLERRPLGLAEEAREALSLISYQFTERNMRLVFDIPPDLPRVSADREFLHRILVNLAGNSVELSPSDSCLKVGARVSPEGDEVVVSVKDEGPGIPKEYQRQIFDKFFQASSRRHDLRKVSVGLGLTFCRLAVEAHGGRIWVESEPGEGACFYFSLPVEAAAPSAS